MRSLIFAALILSCLSSTKAAAQDDGRLVAIQQRKYQLSHELLLGGTLEPQDAFSKGLALEGAYIWHFSDFWSWEVVRGGYMAQLDSGLKTQLLTEFGTQPTAFESLQYYASSALTYAPLYGKFALRNASLIHAEGFLSFGGAFGHFSSSYQAGPELGVGLRVFLSTALSLRFDARDVVFLHKQQNSSLTNQVLLLTLGLSIALGGSSR